MTEEEFYLDYFSGRRDFRNADLKGIDFFTPALRQTHSDFFNKKISSLITENNPIIHKPFEGVVFRGFDLSNTSITETDLLNVDISLSSLSQSDARFSSFLGSNLSELDFTGADLRFATFTGTKITLTNFNNAKLDHATFDLSRIENSNFSECTATSLNFYRSKLLNSTINNCNLKNSSFYLSEIYESSLEESNLENSTLASTDITRTKFDNLKLSKSNITNLKFIELSSTQTDYSRSNIRDSSIFECQHQSDIFINSTLSKINIKNSKLFENEFVGSLIQDCKFIESELVNPIFGETSFIDIDLSLILESQSRHTRASSIDHKSIAKTIMQQGSGIFDIDPHANLRRFLELCGIAPLIAIYLIDSISALSKNQLKELMSSTFISYGGPDLEFAKKLNSDLKKHGIHTFFFPLDAVFGEKLHTTMQKINEYDRTILICSKKSLDRNGLLYELEKTIEKEAREGGNSYLIPIALDDYLFTEWKPTRENLRHEILNRVVADFTNPESYNPQLQRLIQSLKKQA